MSANRPAAPGCDPLLPERVASLSGTAAVTAATSISATVLDQRGGQPGVFAAVGAVRAASEELAAALRLEEGAEARDGVLETEAVAAAEALERAVGAASEALDRLPLPPAARTGMVQELRLALRDWQDPFAVDATGDHELGRLRAVVEGAPAAAEPGLSGVGPAVDRMVSAGQARDAAAVRRQAAIRARVQAEGRWQQAMRALAAAAGPGPWWEVGRPLVTVAEAHRPAAEAMEDAWFS